MLRRSLVRLLFNSDGGKPFQGSTKSLGAVGGLPFYGNIYQGRVDSMNMVQGMPKYQAGGSPRDRNAFSQGMDANMYIPGREHWTDPVLRAKIDRCPYFALCDQVVFHNMDPAHLDPGLLSNEEHQNLLLYSRAYFEKWWRIHQRPVTPGCGNRLRIQYGQAELTKKILRMLGVTVGVEFTLMKEFMFDDSHLIGMNPELWVTASLDDFNRDHLSGRVLEFAGFNAGQRKDFHTLISQMRRLYIKRNDTKDQETIVVPYGEVLTLYDLHKFLGLEPYTTQLKAYNYVNHLGVKMAMTLQTENDYFDYLYTCFFKANLELATLGEMAGPDDCTVRYTLTVEPPAPMARWI